MSRIAIPLEARRSKYGAVATTVNGIRFASKREAVRYRELRLMERAGFITNLRWQVPFSLFGHRHRKGLHFNIVQIATYKADFVYTDMKTGESVVEDVKGVRTPVYKLKKRWFEAQEGRTIQEV